MKYCLSACLIESSISIRSNKIIRRKFKKSKVEIWNRRLHQIHVRSNDSQLTQKVAFQDKRSIQFNRQLKQSNLTKWEASISTIKITWEEYKHNSIELRKKIKKLWRNNSMIRPTLFWIRWMKLKSSLGFKVMKLITFWPCVEANRKCLIMFLILEIYRKLRIFSNRLRMTQSIF